MSQNFECHICDRITRDPGRGQALPLCTFCREAWTRGGQAGLAEGITEGRNLERADVVAWLAENAKENRDTSLAAAGICLKHGEHVRKGDDHG